MPADHPLGAVRRATDEALKALSPRFERLYARAGRPSIAPEKLLRAHFTRRFREMLDGGDLVSRAISATQPSN